MPERRIDPFPMREYAQSLWRIPKHSIPWYLAEIAHARMVTMIGRVPPLERIAHDGGMNVAGFLDLLAGGNGIHPYEAFRTMLTRRERSIKDDVHIVTHGSREYRDAVRDFRSEQKERERAQSRIVFGAAGVFGDGQAVPRGNGRR